MRVEVVREGFCDGDEAALAATFEVSAEEGFALALGEVVDFENGRLTEETAEGGGLGVAGVEEVGAEASGEADGAQGEVIPAETGMGGKPGNRKFDGEAVVMLEKVR